MIYFFPILIVMLKKKKKMYAFDGCDIYTMIYVMQIQRGLGLQGIQHLGEDIWTFGASHQFYFGL